MIDLLEDTIDDALTGFSIKQSISKKTSRCNYNSALINKSIDEKGCTFQSSAYG